MKSLLLGIVFVVLALIVVGAIALGVVNLGLVDRTEAKSHTVYGTIRELVVKSGKGDVEIVPAGDRIRVREEQHFIGPKPTLERTRADGVLTLATTCEDSRDIVPCYSDLRIAVPAGVKITIESSGGDVDLRGVAVSGAHVQTGSGDVELALTGSPGLVWAHTGSGDIELVARKVRAVDAQSDSGDVDVDVVGKPRKVVGRSHSGDVEVGLPRGIYAITAKTDSGASEVSGLQRNRRAASSIDARSGSGDIELRAR